MIYHLLTTQPKIYDSFLKTGLIARGIKKNIIKIKLHSLYDFAIDKHRSIDDSPYGGGAGMILRVDVMDKAISTLKGKNPAFAHATAGRQKSPTLRSESDTESRRTKCKTILLTPQGKPFNQKIAKKLAKEKELILIAGRFEGYDERIRDFANLEISIGDYVLTSGDLPAMVLIDAVSRHIPGFIQKSKSIEEESFNSLKIKNSQIKNLLLEYPQYTRPAEYQEKKVPKILLSGDHAKIEEWRKIKARQRTRKRRPDLTEQPKNMEG